MNALFQPAAMIVALVAIAVAFGLIAWVGRQGPDWGSGPALITERPGHDEQTGQWSRDDLRPAWPTVDADLELLRIRRANALRAARRILIGVPV